MLKAKFKKIDHINSKIIQLKKEQEDIEMTIAKELIKVLKAYGGFEADFEMVAGGIIEVLTTSDQDKKQKWKEEGDRFLHKKRIKSLSHQKIQKN